NLQAGNNNILPNNSNFNIDNGYNVFNILNTSSHHFDGTFPKTGIDVSVPAIKNCFHINSAIQNPVSNVKYFETNNLVQFQFNPTNCIPFVQNEFVIINNFDPNNSNNSYNDTIFFAAEGSGEGISSKVESRIKKIESENLKVLYDSVSIGIRMKNYEKIITNSILILNNYADSIQSISIIPKIYLASLRIDTTGNKITELKAILETLILNNPNNEPLISQSYYFIQKCKVALSQYQSAMTGFQQIINQNPYSYEGLVASWDYAATSLLLSGGSGGGEKDLEIGSSDLEINKSESSEMDINEEVKSQIQNSKSQILNDDPNDKYDTKIFTKEDRQVLRTNIYKSFESSRDKVTEKNKSLEKKIKDGTADEQEKTEFKNKTILKEIVKAKKPHNITEHVNFVNKDIQILFGSEKDNSIIETNNLIPTEFNLSQNYPNPFNPKTKITFDLPVDAKVKLIIYDMLGKEIIRLVNNEFRSVGRYKVDFNGSNLSSGVYFYKLETEGEKNFSLTKRMVLIK
ncbi:MAG TPA: T9SS type A sorting domain-containing protein, partial [Ignavibacteria bacterium]|nr:T9SS type A sorting domain-containing protein [Ignavibacteria bacterium]